MAREYLREKANTVDILITIVCFLRRVNNFKIKELIYTSYCVCIFKCWFIFSTSVFRQLWQLKVSCFPALVS